MSFYECTFIARHDMSPADVQKLTESLSKIITDGKGKVVKSEYWGLRNLAYKINKAGKGHYTMLGLDAPYAAVAEMERQMRINEDIIRNLTIKVDMMDATPSIVMKQKSGDNDSADEAA